MPPVDIDDDLELPRREWRFTRLRGLAVYAFLLMLLRLAGKRTLAQKPNFDLVLLLVVAEATQQGMIGDDFSATQAFVIIVTLVAADVGFKLAEGVPLVIVEDGVARQGLMRRARVDLNDVLEAARERQGLERLEQITFAVLERGGGIWIIPKGAGEAS